MGGGALSRDPGRDHVLNSRPTPTPKPPANAPQGRPGRPTAAGWGCGPRGPAGPDASAVVTPAVRGSARAAEEAGRRAGGPAGPPS